MPKRKPPKPTQTNGRNAARQTVRKARTIKAAAELVKGATVTGAAKAVGITSRQLYTDLREPELQAAFASLYAQNADRFSKLFGRSLEVIEDALDATAVVKTDLGAILTDYPDHVVRLRAVAQLRHLIDVGQRFAAPQGQPLGGLQWEELQAFVVTYRSSRVPPS